MDFHLLHPREQITQIMDRIYRGGLTTTSGGNISIRDRSGNIWITPGGIDKRHLRPEDIVCCFPDGKTEGLHKPSSELSFHQAIYDKRNYIQAIVHAHSPALVAFSIVRQIPDTKVIPQALHVYGPVGYAPYGKDRRRLEPKDLVRVRGGEREKGGKPSRAVLIHQAVYANDRNIHCIISSQSPNAIAFCIAGMALNTKTIPESYVVLKEIPLLPFGSQAADSPVIPQTLSGETPILFIQNDSVWVSGGSLKESFDRLEVTEFSAHSLISSLSLGELVPIDDQEIEELKEAFM